jgi:hypothetical protein
VNNLVYQITRDTLVNEPNDNIQNNESLSTKRIPAPPIVSVVPPPIPVRTHANDNTTAMNNNNEKSRKQPDQPPELPPKTNRALAAAGKFSSPGNPNVPTAKTNPTVNKENHHLATAESEQVSPTNEGKLVPRHKPKNARRKMTEEEAIKELG